MLRLPPTSTLFPYTTLFRSTPVIAGDSFEMDAVGALRLSPLRRGLAIDSMEKDRSEERFSRNAETDLVCRLLLEKKKTRVDVGRDLIGTMAAVRGMGYAGVY